MGGSDLLTMNMTLLKDARHMPGYAGYRPKEKYTYGETFGAATAKYFQAKRLEELNTSVLKDKAVDCDGRVRFPSLYCNKPALVLAARKKNRERWRAAPKYRILNHHQRDSEIETFDQQAQSHREYYTDKTGTLNSIEYFVIPKNQNVLLPIEPKQAESKDTQVSSCDEDETPPKHHLCGCKAPLDVREYRNKHHPSPARRDLPHSTWRERHIRDVYFDRR